MIHPARKVGILYTPRDPGSQQQLDDVKKNAVKLGIAVYEGAVSTPASIDTELNKLLDKCEVVVITEGGLFGQHFERIAAKAKAKKVPLASTIPDAAEKGAIVSLEVNPQEQGYLAAEMAVRVLEGAKTEYLSLIKSQRVDLIINLRNARELGIQVPFAAVRSATRLIK
jgi:putative ABC transport system substrate-binding protein